VVTVGWAIFRSPSLTYAFELIKAMAGFGAGGQTPADVVPDAFVLIVILAGIIGSTPWYRGLFPRAEWTLSALSSRSAHLAHVAGLAVLMFGCFAFVASQTHVAFIYFRF
jgi:alginate O-acetyltransferase complex protein AlgI